MLDTTSVFSDYTRHHTHSSKSCRDSYNGGTDSRHDLLLDTITHPFAQEVSAAAHCRAGHSLQTHEDAQVCYTDAQRHRGVQRLLQAQPPHCTFRHAYKVFL